MSHIPLPDGATIRGATADDVPVVLELIKALAEYERLSHLVVADESALRETLFGGTHGPEVLIGELNGEPVGFALFFHNYSTFLARQGIWLEDLFVKPHARGTGLGKALLLSVASIAKQRNCGRFEWAVLDWNTPSIEFYKSLGAKPLNDWTIMRVTGADLNNMPG